MSNDKILGEEQLEVLRQVQTFAPEAIIGGGAVRDLVMGKPFRDVDIWMGCQDPARNWQAFIECTLPTLVNLRRGDFVDPVHINVPPMAIQEVVPGGPRQARAWDRPGFAAERLARVRQEWVVQGVNQQRYQHLDGLNLIVNLNLSGVQYQLIGVSYDPVKFLNKHFDIGFCKIWHNGKDVIRSKAFDHDRKNSVLTCRPPSWHAASDEAGIQRRFDRLRSKYPDFKTEIVTAHLGKQPPAPDYGAANWTTTNAAIVMNDLIPPLRPQRR